MVHGQTHLTNVCCFRDTWSPMNSQTLRQGSRSIIICHARMALIIHHWNDVIANWRSNDETVSPGMMNVAASQLTTGRRVRRYWLTRTDQTMVFLTFWGSRLTIRQALHCNESCWQWELKLRRWRDVSNQICDKKPRRNLKFEKWNNVYFLLLVDHYSWREYMFYISCLRIFILKI